MPTPDFVKKWASSRPSIPEISSPDYALGFANYLGAIPPSTDDHDYIMNLQDERAIWLYQNKANLDSPTFTGAPSAPTAPQFDNDTSIATTAFVQRAIGNFKNLAQLNGATVLGADYCGNEVLLSGATGYTVTMPAVSEVTTGAAIHFTASIGPVVVQRAGTDLFVVGNGTATSLTLNIGDTLSLVSTGAVWLAAAGTAQLPYSARFGASFATNGYQKLPSGLIIQWGAIPSTLDDQNSVVTFPIAFPNACHAVCATNDTANSGAASFNVTSKTITTCTFRNSSSVATAQGGYYIAIGQ